MNRFVLAGVLGIAILGVVAAGDEIVEGRRGLTSDTSPTTKQVTITGLQNGRVLTYSSDGYESGRPLIDFTKINIDGMPDFNKAEELLSMGKFTDAVAAYDNITGLDGWKKELVAARKNFASLMKFQFATALKYKGDDVLAKIAEAKKRAVSQPTVAMLAATSQPVGVSDIPPSLLSAVVEYQFSPTEPTWVLRPFLSEQQCKQIAEKQTPMFEKLNEVMKGLVVAVSVADMKNVMFEKIDDSQYKIVLIADGYEDLSSTVVKGIVSTEMMKAIKSRNRLEQLPK